ncbi:hypothetical protein [Ramlibacter aurantiacus]|uniref:hypothetical protein n=1 Tax=Ramlibacter aurantiacus TaxID=2801330 RepID=UPI001F33B281|nr:hypothetical protein [Ramlibacter aurantiacus]
MTNLLDAVLVNGFNLRTVASITREGNTATVTYATAHGYEVNQILQVEGAEQAAYNGQYRITYVDSLTLRFVLATGSTPVTPATGTISTKAAALGFQIAYTGTQKRVYRSPNVQGSRPFIRVDDGMPVGYTTTWAKFARVTIAESMSDVDTFLPGGRAPFDPNNPNINEQGNGGTGTGGIYGWNKWYYASLWTNQSSYSESSGDGGNMARTWFIVGDDRLFYVFLAPRNQNDGRMFYAAGEFNSFKAGDNYNSLLFATDRWSNAANSVTYWFDNGGAPWMFDFNGRYAMRAWHQTGGHMRLSMLSMMHTQNIGSIRSGYTGGITFPNGPDMGVIAHPIYLREENPAHVRGLLPGPHYVMHNAPYAHREVLDNVIGQPGRKMMYVTCAGGYGSGEGNSCGMLFDITGPWR